MLEGRGPIQLWRLGPHAPPPMQDRIPRYAVRSFNWPDSTNIVSCAPYLSCKVSYRNTCVCICIRRNDISLHSQLSQFVNQNWMAPITRTLAPCVLQWSKKWRFHSSTMHHRVWYFSAFLILAVVTILFSQGKKASQDHRHCGKRAIAMGYPDGHIVLRCTQQLASVMPIFRAR